MMAALGPSKKPLADAPPPSKRNRRRGKDRAVNLDLDTLIDRDVDPTVFMVILPLVYPRLTVNDLFENNLRSQTVSQQLPRTSIEGEDSILPPQTLGRFPSSHKVKPLPLSDSKGLDVNYNQPNVDEVNEDN